MSPIAFAARGGYLEIVKLLLKVKGVELHHNFVPSLTITDILLYEEWSRFIRERYLLIGRGILAGVQKKRVRYGNYTGLLSYSKCYRSRSS